MKEIPTLPDKAQTAGPETGAVAETLKPEESVEIKQGNIAHEYLREHESWRKLNESYQNTLRSLDKLRGEGLLKDDDPTIKKVEEELRNTSALMSGSQIYMKRLFDQLSNVSKEKYLKPPEEAK